MARVKPQTKEEPAKAGLPIPIIVGAAGVYMYHKIIFKFSILYEQLYRKKNLNTICTFWKQKQIVVTPYNKSDLQLFQGSNRNVL